MRIVLLALTFAGSCIAQGSYVRAVSSEELQSRAASAAAGNTSKVDLSQGRPVLVTEADKVFPHLALGGGWETVIVLVNMGTADVNFRLSFFGQDGSPLAVTFRTIPEGTLLTTTVAEGRLLPKASFNFVVFDQGTTTRVGWALLDYDSGSNRLGGYAIFRQRIPGRADYEALVPLSAFDDYRFLMPFDNIQGFVTAMALTNPNLNLSNRITITALSLEGTIIAENTITLPPGGQTAFVLADRIPALANRLGTLSVVSDTSRLSGLGIRFNGTGGNAFSSVPIMNWSGMF